MKTVIIFLLSMACVRANAQTDLDAIMMGKNKFCVGPTFSSSSWTNYWEGTLKRNNLNLGKVSTQNLSVMGSYGISSRLNVLFNVPYIKTKASAGTLSGMQGFQDLSLFVKWMPVKSDVLGGTVSVFGIAGFSVPLSNYVVDFLPMSIGLGSRTASARLMADYQTGGFFVTGSATYVGRDNIDIDRDSYYTTRMHLTNEVHIPDAANFNFRVGYRNRRLIAEAVANSWKTLGGFDITRNNMPSPGNRMNATMIGGNVKYVLLPAKHEFSLVAGGNTTVAGRNVGQSTTWYGGLVCAFDFSRKQATAGEPSKIN